MSVSFSSRGSVMHLISGNRWHWKQCTSALSGVVPLLLPKSGYKKKTPATGCALIKTRTKGHKERLVAKYMAGVVLIIVKVLDLCKSLSFSLFFTSTINQQASCVPPYYFLQLQVHYLKWLLLLVGSILTKKKKKENLLNEKARPNHIYL